MEEKETLDINNASKFDTLQFVVSVEANQASMIRYRYLFNDYYDDSDNHINAHFCNLDNVYVSLLVV